MINSPDEPWVRREVVGRRGRCVLVREVWDLQMPGCPMVAVRTDPFGPQPLAISYERIVRVPDQTVSTS